MDKVYYISIAEHVIKLEFKEGKNDLNLIPSVVPFLIESPTEKPLLEIIVDDKLMPVPKEKRKRVRDFETGNGHTIVDHTENGGYQFIIKNIDGANCCLLIAEKGFNRCWCALNGNYNMRCFGLNNALMEAFAFAGSQCQTLLIHASLVRNNGYGYAFIAKSGTGKSTQVSIWLRYIPGCDLMNDDNPAVRVIDGVPYIYGTPWSGKTPCYRNVKARLGAITRIDRAKENSVEKLSPVEAFASTLPSCATMKWDKDIFNGCCDTVTKIVETTGIYILHCLPNKEAGLICYKAIAK